MKLTELEPQWMMREGLRIGFVFLSPVQPKRHDGSARTDRYRLTCMAAPTPMDVQREVAEAMFGDDDYTVVPCNPTQGWTISGGIEGASFENISASPSIDGSASGNWHGYVTAGQIVGGL